MWQHSSHQGELYGKNRCVMSLLWWCHSGLLPGSPQHWQVGRIGCWTWQTFNLTQSVLIDQRIKLCSNIQTATTGRPVPLTCFILLGILPCEMIQMHQLRAGEGGGCFGKRWTKFFLHHSLLLLLVFCNQYNSPKLMYLLFNLPPGLILPIKQCKDESSDKKERVCPASLSMSKRFLVSA